MAKTDNVLKGVDLILPSFLIFSLPEMYLDNPTIGLSIKVLSYIFILAALKKIIYNNTCNFKTLFNIYFIFYIGTIINYLYNDVSIKCFLNEVFNSIPAMLMVYIGMCRKNDNNRFYEWFLKVCTISMIIGILLYVTMPGWYIGRIVEQYNNTWFAKTKYNEEELSSVLRFSSYLGDTYIVDIFAMFGLSIALFYYYSNQYFNNKILLISILIMLLSALLTQQRVAMVCSVFTFFFYICYGLKNSNKNKSITLLNYFVIIVFIGGIYLIAKFGDRMDTFVNLFSDRMENLSVSKAWGERNYQIKLLTDHWKYIIFGHGVGSGGSIARSMGYPGVSDCSWIELTYETGIVGMLMFVSLMILTLYRCLKYFRYLLLESVTITFVLVAMIGSNTLSMGFFSIIPFWYTVGSVWNKLYLRNKIANKLKV